MSHSNLHFPVTFPVKRYCAVLPLVVRVKGFANRLNVEFFLLECSVFLKLMFCCIPTPCSVILEVDPHIIIQRAAVKGDDGTFSENTVANVRHLLTFDNENPLNKLVYSSLILG